MKRPKVYLLFSAFVTILSCGPSAQERAIQQQQHDDSLLRAGQDKQKNMMAMQDSLKRLRIQKDDYENQIVSYNATLEMEKDKMNRIKEFQLLRTSEERDQQIKDQSMLIQKIEKDINTLKNNLSITEEGILDAEKKITTLN